MSTRKTTTSTTFDTNVPPTDSALDHELLIVQQPVRARMCGLGDKDRRQISPPPFVKLRITEKATGLEVDVDRVNINSFVLVAELWSLDQKENLTLNQNITIESKQDQAIVSEDIDSDEDGIVSKDRSANDGEVSISQGEVVPSAEFINDQETPANSYSDESLGDVPTRNLIGNLVINPFKLFDESGKKGIWFIMHDLSVRIEGEFKLKFLFVDLISNQTVHTFSQPFKVYSAKKFPGVVESSPLGKLFASQGVKIPVRREKQDNSGISFLE